MTFQSPFRIAARDVWLESTTADNAVAAATRAAEEGKTHYIIAITGSYENTKSGLLQIKDGDTTIYQFVVYDTTHLEFPEPLPMTMGNAVTLQLAASGSSGELGYVNCMGVTL